MSNPRTGTLGGRSRAADKFVIRLPDGMRDCLATGSRLKHRSMNSQAIVYLAEGMSRDGIDISEIDIAFEEGDEKAFTPTQAGSTGIPLTRGMFIQTRNGIRCLENIVETSRGGSLVAVVTETTGTFRTIPEEYPLDEIEPLLK